MLHVEAVGLQRFISLRSQAIQNPDSWALEATLPFRLLCYDSGVCPELQHDNVKICACAVPSSQHRQGHATSICVGEL
jgi:hypothetical protein